MLRRRHRDEPDDDLSYRGVIGEIDLDEGRPRGARRSKTLRAKPTWLGFTALVLVFLGALALFIGGVVAEVNARDRVAQLNAAASCATVLPPKTTNAPANYPRCAVWITTKVYDLDIPDKGTTDLTLADDSSGLWFLFYQSAPGLVRGLHDDQSATMLVWRGDAVAVGLTPADYALDDASPQASEGLALGTILLGLAALLLSGTGLYSNLDRRLHPEDRRRRIGVTPLVLINSCLAVPLAFGGLATLGSSPGIFGALIFMGCCAFVLWCLFGWLLVRQRIQRRVGLLT